METKNTVRIDVIPIVDNPAFSDAEMLSFAARKWASKIPIRVSFRGKSFKMVRGNGCTIIEKG